MNRHKGVPRTHCQTDLGWRKLRGPGWEFQGSRSPWLTASRHLKSLLSPFSSQHSQHWFAPVQWPRLLSVNWFPGAHRHCHSLRLITLFDYCNTIIMHFLLCMLYLSVFMLYSAATVSIEHRQLYPKEGCKGKGSGEIYVALGNLGAKMWNKC